MMYLYVKPIESPLEIKKLEALLRRISHNHPAREKITTDLGKYTSGLLRRKVTRIFSKSTP